MDKANIDEALADAAGRVSRYPEHMQGSLAAAVFLAELLRPRVESAAVAQRSSVPRSPSEARDGLPGTLGEFLADFGDLAHPDRITAIAAFRFESEGVESLTADELREAYAEVRASKPQNLSANIARSMSKGWLVQASPKEGKKAWRVTQRGIEQVRQWRTSE